MLNMNNRFNGNKLKEALQYRGLRMSDLARQTNLSKQSISQYCNDATEPSFPNISKIAFALGFPPEFFLNRDSISVETSNIYFRSQAAATKTTQISQRIKMEYVGRLYEVLLNYVDLPSLNIPIVQFEGGNDPIDSDSVNVAGEIENIASFVRKEWSLGKGPITNLQYVLESHGIIVTGFRNVDDRIDAFSQKMKVNDNIYYVVALSLGKKPLERLRFDMGHELGHILFHDWDDPHEALSKEEFNAQEKQANLFASALLLPKDAFYRDIAPYSTELEYYLELKKKWRVSMQAMIYRARQLDIISWNQYSYMMRQVSKRGWRTNEPGYIPGKLNPTIFQASIDTLLEGEYLSKHDLRMSFLKNGIYLNETELEDLMALKEGTLGIDESDKEIEPNTKVLQFRIKDNK